MTWSSNISIITKLNHECSKKLVALWSTSTAERFYKNLCHGHSEEDSVEKKELKNISERDVLFFFILVYFAPRSTLVLFISIKFQFSNFVNIVDLCFTGMETESDAEIKIFYFLYFFFPTGMARDIGNGVERQVLFKLKPKWTMKTTK